MIRTLTIESVTLQDDGSLQVGFIGTGHGVAFDSLGALREAVRGALARDREHQGLMAVAAYMRATDPGLTNPGGLVGLSFTADDGNG